MKIFKNQFLNDLSAWICSIIGTAVIVGLGLQLTLQVTPTTALADPTPACTATPTITPSPSCTPTPTVCHGCGGDPDCTPTPFPVVGNDPILVDLPSGYQPSDGTTLQWRVYPPNFLFAAASPSPTATPLSTPGPAVIVVHGGAFRAGHPFQPGVEAAALGISRAGFWVFVPTYRLALCGKILNQPAHDGDPAHVGSGRVPEQTDDMMYIIKAVRADSRCNGKVGLVGASSGATLAVYTSLDPNSISQTGRPAWSPEDDRADCVVTFSGIFDLSDNSSADLPKYQEYVDGIANYIGTCDREDPGASIDQKRFSPIVLIDSNTKNSFKPLLAFHADEDGVVPNRQLSDLECALIGAGVSTSDYTITHVPNNDHAFDLWNDPDPDHPGQRISKTSTDFLHEYLDP